MEYDLMLENQKLKLENNDLLNYKSRQKNNSGELESRVKRYQEEIKVTREENIKLKGEVSQLKQHKEFEVQDLENEMRLLKQKYADLEEENKKFRSHIQERARTHQADSDYYQDYEARSEAQKHRVHQLLEYKAKPSEGSELPETASESNYHPRSDVQDENDEPVDTPNRLQYPCTSDKEFVPNNKRRFVKNYVIREENDSKEDRSSSDKDRDIYGGFKENESDASSVFEEDNNNYKQHLLQSVERRVGGKEFI